MGLDSETGTETLNFRTKCDGFSQCAAQTLRWSVSTTIRSWRKRASPVWTENIFPRAQNEENSWSHRKYFLTSLLEKCMNLPSISLTALKPVAHQSITIWSNTTLYDTTSLGKSFSLKLVSQRRMCSGTQLDSLI